jgi:hypothetical protein
MKVVRTQVRIYKKLEEIENKHNNMNWMVI